MDCTSQRRTVANLDSAAALGITTGLKASVLKASCGHTSGGETAARGTALPAEAGPHIAPDSMCPAVSARHGVRGLHMRGVASLWWHFAWCSAKVLRHLMCHGCTSFLVS